MRDIGFKLLTLHLAPVCSLTLRHCNNAVCGARGKLIVLAEKFRRG